MQKEKKKIVLVYPEDEIREIIIMILESEFELEVVEVEKIQQAKDLIQKEEHIGVILSEYFMKGGVGSEIFATNAKSQNVPFLFLSKGDIPEDALLDTFSQSNPKNDKIKIPFDHEFLVERIKNAISEQIHETETHVNHSIKLQKLTNNLASEAVKNPYFRVKVNRLKLQKDLIGDVYVKLGQDKMIKMAHRADGVNKDKLEQLEKKGVEFVYFSRSDYDDFIRSKISNLLDKWKDGSLEGEELLGLQLKSMEQVREFASSVGIPGPVLELTEKVADSVMHELNKNLNMGQFLDTIKGQQNYFFQLSQLVNYLCTTICTQMKWNDEEQASKLIYASMFCDIALTNSRLASIMSMNDSYYLQLPSGQQDIVTGHMVKAMDMVEKSNLGIKELDKIIFYHHERPDGSGYPQGLTADRIPPIAAAFIVPYDLATRILQRGDRGEAVNILEILAEMEPIYSIGHFKSIILALKNGLK